MALLQQPLFLLLVCARLAPSHACSNFFMNNDTFRISARTMDLGSGNFEMVVRPAGKNGSLGLVTFAPSEAGVAVDTFSTGGLNEAGLSCDLQTLIHSEFPKPTAGKLTVPAQGFCLWALGDHSSVRSVKAALHSIVVVEGISPNCHFVLRDAVGESLVLEFIGGAMHVHDDFNDDGVTGFGIMTNEPAFQYQLDNVRHLQWKRGLARQSVSVPGSWYPEERFMRIYMVKAGMAPPKTYRQAVIQAVHVLNTVTVPMGAQWGTDSGAKSGEGAGDHTLYGVLYDHLGKMLYWRTTENQNLQKLDLVSTLRRGSGAKLRLPVVRNQQPWFHDASDAFNRD